ncbi:MAG: homoserine O-acetyltransferase [Bacteroidota bacterium]
MEKLTVSETFLLESSETLDQLQISYQTYGELNDEKSNVVWIFHALTGNSDPFEWWPGVVGRGSIIDPSDFFIVCANMLGSCYGSTEPTDFEFPLITIRDQVNAFKLLKEYLKINRIQVGIGGSMGGQQLLEWAVQEPLLFETIVPIATNARHSPWGIAFNETQRMAIENNPEKGLETARAVAMLSYRHFTTYQQTQKDSDNRSDDFSASSYQRYQGQKLSRRFSPFSYYTLSKAMDSHNVARSYHDDMNRALQQIKSKAVIIGIDSDILFPTSEQRFLAESIDNSNFFQLNSIYGHDGFLIEVNQINEILKNEL